MTKLLIVGLDGGTFDLLKPWVETGHLPNFAQLLATGSYGRLRSVPNTDTAPAWTTFATGLNPANHGIFHEFNWSADRRTLQRVQQAMTAAPPFWQLASDAGRRVVVVNVPFSYPAVPLNGLMVAGFGAPGETAPDFCYPPKLLDDIQQAVGCYHIDSPIQAAIHANQPHKGLQESHTVAQRRTDAMLYALDQTHWDLAVVVYNLPDVMQHFFWQQMVQQNGPQQHAIRDGYMFMDEQIGRLLTHAGPETNVLLMSDHGFGPLCATPQYVAEWLAEQGFTSRLEESRMPWQQHMMKGAYGWLRRRLSESMKEKLRRSLPGMRDRVESEARFAGIDWLATVAYAGPSPYEIWINCRGREPQGIVAPGTEYEAICLAITEALLGWQDAATGQIRVRAVHRREEVYNGRFQHLAPDLTIEWNPAAAPAAHTLPGNSSKFDADHQPEGLLLLAGPAMAVSREITGATLADLAPTILHLLQVPPPQRLDGRVLTESLRA